MMQMNSKKTFGNKQMPHGKKRQRRKRTGLYVMVAVVLVLTGVLTVKKNELDVSCKKQEQQKEELVEKIQVLNDQQKEIKSQTAYVQTPKYIEDIAREKLGLVYKNEVIFKPQK